MFDQYDIVICVCKYDKIGVDAYLKTGVVLESKHIENTESYNVTVEFSDFISVIPSYALRKIGEI